MELNNLRPAKGSVRANSKRIGRGEGSGKGGTSTRGHKGAKSRSGYSKKIGFEGGQMPLQRRVPKFGFNNRNRKEYQGVNLDTLQKLVDNGKINEMPLQRRVPKFGFNNRNRKEYQGVNLDTLQKLVDNGKINDTVDLQTLLDNRLATKTDLVKILGRGELKAKLKVSAHKFTASAKEAIEAAGGEAVTL